MSSVIGKGLLLRGWACHWNVHQSQTVMKRWMEGGREGCEARSGLNISFLCSLEAGVVMYVCMCGVFVTVPTASDVWVSPGVIL